MTDYRRMNTETMIENRFMTLLENKALNKITVTEIIRDCGISRGTFYLHYQDVYALYDQVVNRLIKTLEQLFDRTYPISKKVDSTALMHFVNQLIAYVAAHQTIWTAVLANQQDHDIISELRILFTKKILAANGADHHDTVAYTQVSFCISGIIGVLSDWIDHGEHFSETQLEKQIQMSLAAI